MSKSYQNSQACVTDLGNQSQKDKVINLQDFLPLYKEGSKDLEPFSPWQEHSILAIGELNLSGKELYLYICLRHENPFFDRNVFINAADFCRKWKINKKTFYRGIGKLEDIGLIQIRESNFEIALPSMPEGEKSTRLQEKVYKSQEKVYKKNAQNVEGQIIDTVSDPRQKSQIRDKSLRSATKVSDLRKSKSETLTQQGIQNPSDSSDSTDCSRQAVESGREKDVNFSSAPLGGLNKNSPSKEVLSNTAAYSGKELLNPGENLGGKEKPILKNSPEKSRKFNSEVNPTSDKLKQILIDLKLESDRQVLQAIKDRGEDKVLKALEEIRDKSLSPQASKSLLLGNTKSAPNLSPEDKENKDILDSQLEGYNSELLKNSYGKEWQKAAYHFWGDNWQAELEKRDQAEKNTDNSVSNFLASTLAKLKEKQKLRKKLGAL